jgi:glycosyltransferase involved in cell wall biosynthesis
MFTIIIPLYNKQNSITNTLRSVTNQSIHDFEVLVINDGSTDLSIQKVHEFIQVDQRILLIHKENGGVCTARNLGIEKSNNSFISFLDADDYWEPTYLEEQLRLIHDFPKAAMWGMNFAPVSNGIVEKLYTGLPENYRGYVTDYFTSGRVSDLFCSSSVVVRKEAFNVAGMFDTRIRFSEDLDMWYRIILNFPVAFDARIFVYYDQDTENRAMHKDKPLKEWLTLFCFEYDSYSERNCAFSHIYIPSLLTLAIITLARMDKEKMRK